MNTATQGCKNAVKAWICAFKGVRSCGKGAYIAFSSEITGPEKVSLGSHSTLAAHARICANGSQAHIRIGEYTQILPYVLLKANNGGIAIGSYCSINDYTVMYGNGTITIGNDVHIASHSVLVANTHDYHLLGTHEFSMRVPGRGIAIEDSVWIGAGVKVLDGVRIGTGAVIGAGAVVVEDIPAYSVAVGIPARVIKKWK